MERVIRLNERELHKIIMESFNEINNKVPENQTDLESVILSRNLALIISQLNSNYDLQYNYGDDLDEFAVSLESIIQKQKQLKPVVNNFINAGIQLLKAFGDYEY